LLTLSLAVGVIHFAGTAHVCLGVRKIVAKPRRLNRILITDIAPVHDRQVAVLPPEDWGAWIYLTKSESELLKPSPVGALTHDVIRQGKG